MNRSIERKDEIMVVVIVLMLIVLFAGGNARSRANVQRSKEIRQCQDRCIEVWGDGPVVKLADCLVACNPEDYP